MDVTGVIIVTVEMTLGMRVVAKEVEEALLSIMVLMLVL